MIRQRIITISAKSLFKYFPKKKEQEKKPFCFDTRKRTLYALVVKEENEMEECPMLHQLLEVLKEGLGEKFDSGNEYLIYDQFLIMDFEDIFLPIDENATEAARKWRKGLRDYVKDLMENGFELRFDAEHSVHMMPFDKSGNMSRNSRISFVNSAYAKELNERLNLGMDFRCIPVNLSKYYAYRGLYLSTSQRVCHDKFKITPETLIIVNDRRKASGSSFERNVKIATAEQGQNPGEWAFKEPEEIEIKTVDTPFDGQGLITPEYAAYINEALGVRGANSFQIRLPFAKGMLHQVDVIGFVEEFSSAGLDEKQYLYTDAFGKERDLSKARIFMTESMFKGKKWLESYCIEHEIDDPMQYYCEMLEAFNHGFYVSGTDLPYGHSKYTHLTYQTINTLAFDDAQFERIIEGHGKFIKNPISFLKGWDEIEYEDTVKEEGEPKYRLPGWKHAVLQESSLAGDKYIKEQLENTQKSLLTKIAMGKILVKGQTRYLCRDLAPLLYSLLKEDKDVKEAYLRGLYTRFYLPRGRKKNIKLNFEDYYAFFRNPHLSRNEQYIMRAFVLPENEAAYAKDGARSYEKYVKYVKMYDKYFGHLTGIVMVPRGSTLPLCLGGADFDGDLVSVIFDQDVVAAVIKGAYKWMDSESLYYYKRVLPAVEIPSTHAKDVVVPEYVEYEHIENTFSNHIGRISNAAISIGQVEYARGTDVETSFDANTPTCAKCTLLTGLEIDSAKNGIHPNLDLILKTGIKKNAYLAFLRGFKELKSEKNFHLDKLTVEQDKKETDGIERDVIIIGAKNCGKKVEWYPDEEERGTYINWLPKYFLRYYEIFKKQKSEVIKPNIKKKPKFSAAEKPVIEKFEASCDGVFGLYHFYKNSFLKKLAEEKNKGYYAVENTETLLIRTYDEDQIDDMLFQVLPDLRTKIGEALADDSVIGEVRKRINGLQWQFQPRSKRGEALEQIIGNGFKESVLTEEERNLLYHFNQQGYRLLWRLMDLIEGPKLDTYKEVYDKLQEEQNMTFSEEFTELEAILHKELRRYYDNNASNVEQTLYIHCLNVIKSLIEKYSRSIEEREKLVYVMYRKTKSATGKARFFWDIFSWEDVKLIFEGKGAVPSC